MKKKISVLLVLFLALVSIAIPVFAKDNRFQSGDNLTVKEQFASSFFGAGNNVNFSSEVDGASFIAGNHVNVSSKQDMLFVAGSSINIENVITKDAYLAGATIVINPSTIRDLYAAAANIEVNSDITGNAYLSGANVTINSKIYGDVVTDADVVTLGDGAVIEGTLKYHEGGTVDNNNASVGNLEVYKIEEEEELKKLTFATKITEKILSFVSLLAVAFILLLLNKKMFKKLDKEEKSFGEVAKSCGIGLLFLITVPVAFIVLLITVIGIPLALISLLVYAILIYLSAIPATYYLGKTFLDKKIKNDYLLMTLSLLALYILKFIPIIGGLCSFIILILGLGLFTKLIINNAKEK